jgi:hypothetical protein
MRKFVAAGDRSRNRSLAAFFAFSATHNFASVANLLKGDVAEINEKELAGLSLRIGLEKRMQIHVAALTQKALGYDEFTRLALEQERITQQASETGVTTEERPSSDQSRVAFPPHAQSLKTNPEIPGDKDVRTRRHLISSAVCRTKTEDEPKKSIRQRLVVVRAAWRQFHKSHDRDGVYGYLRAVFSLVKHYRGRRRTKKLVRRASRFAGLPIDMNADPFAVVMRCTCEKKLDRKTISKWSRALRYAARSKKPRVRLIPFLKKRGGINGCAALYAEQFGQGKR